MAKGRGKNLGTARGEVEIDVSSARKAIVLVSHDLTKMRGDADAVAKALAKIGQGGGAGGGLPKVKTDAELANERLDRLKGNLGTVSNALGALTLPLVAAGSAAGVLGARFDEQLRKVNSIAKLSEEALGELGEQFVDLSRDASKTREGATSLASGFYEIQSAGYSGAAGMDVLEVATKAASAGMTETAVSGRAITAVLNAYRLGADEAGRVSDVLFRTVDQGVLNFPELASSIGRVIPTAAAANVSIEEVGAAVAALTKGGLSAGQSVTDLNSLLTSIIKPTQQAKDLAEELGIDYSLTALKAKGLAGFLADLNAKTGGNAESMATLIGSQEGLTAALALTQGEMGEFRFQLDAMGKAAGATDAAFDEMGKSTTAQLALAKNQFEALGIKVGSVLLPAVNDALGAVTGLVDGFLNLPKDEQERWINIALAIGGTVVALFAVTKAVQGVIAVVGVAKAAYALYTSATAAASAATAIFAAKIALIALPVAALVYGLNQLNKQVDAGIARVNAHSKAIQGATAAQELFNQAQSEGFASKKTAELQAQLDELLKKREAFLREAAKDEGKTRIIEDIFGGLIDFNPDNMRVIAEQTGLADEQIRALSEALTQSVEADRTSTEAIRENARAQLEREQAQAAAARELERLRSVQGVLTLAVNEYAAANRLSRRETDALQLAATENISIFADLVTAQGAATSEAIGMDRAVQASGNTFAALSPELAGVAEALSGMPLEVTAEGFVKLGGAAAATEEQLEAAKKAIEGVLSEGPGALQALLNTNSSFVTDRETLIREHEERVKEIQATGNADQLAEENRTHGEQLTALQVAHANQLAEDRRHYGQQLIEYINAKAMMVEGDEAYVTAYRQRAGELVQAISQEYGVVTDVATTTFGDALNLADEYLSTGGQGIDSFTARLGLSQESAARMQDRINTLVNEGLADLQRQLDANLISQEEYNEAAGKLPAQITTKVIAETETAQKSVETLLELSDEAAKARFLGITTNAPDATKKVRELRDVAGSIAQSYAIRFSATIPPMLLRQSPAPIEQVLENVRRGATSKIDVQGVEGVQKLVDLTGRLATLTPSLGNIGTGRGASASLASVFATLRTASELAAADAAVFNAKTAEATGTYLDTAGKALDVIGRGSEALTKLNDVKMPPREALTGFFYTIRDAVADAGARAKENDDDVGELTTLWLDTSSKAVDLLGKGADAFTKLEDLSLPPREGLLAFSFAVRDAVADAAARSRENETDLGELTDKWLETSGKTVDVLGKGADALAKLASDEFKVPPREGLTKFFFAIRDAVADAAARARDNANDLDELTTAWLETAGKAVALLAQGAEGFNKINRGVVVNDRALVTFFDAAERAIILAAERARRLDPEAVEAATVVAEAMGKVLSPISSGVDAFEAVSELDFGKAFIPKLERVFAVMEYAIQLTIRMSGRLNSEGVAAAAELGAAASEMFGGLNAALSFMTDLQEGKLPSRDQLNAFAGAFFEVVAVAQLMATRSSDIVTAGQTFFDNITAGVTAIRSGFTDLANLDGLGVSIQAAISASVTQGAGPGLGATPPPVPPAVAAVGIPPSAGAGIGSAPGPARGALGGGGAGGAYYDQRQINIPTTINTPIDLRQLLQELRELVAEEQGGG